ncbi:Acetyltransferase (GNAT) domain-containing protein [Aliiroseovarius halocynthiae]|uniref:GNAT family N-acetyltransferase n=1 Tax=Aliiroseovarius halocynthiae TaxID=985055 RepID=A0A545SVZ4_9RHOB|nr:GNAT family N-acetyltransferase [Aliiroseovarius halocynthiae]TQV69138.1 GNAT family N-acetyltransferase [Aliiroseovarius halocynthiae]SMR71894.1 Acetyltransferase (GNAT) domain-containing protein [Aliiroseovarius halocynthiae]
MKTCLKTERLELRLTQPEDFDAVHAMVSDYDVTRMTGTWPYPADPEFTKSRCVPADIELGLTGAIFCDGALVGTIGIASRDGGDPEMGYMFARAHWGQGYASEMGRALIAHCWATYDWPLIRAGVFADNPGSTRVLEKLGFTELEPGTAESLARGGSHPLRNFQLLRPQS